MVAARFAMDRNTYILVAAGPYGAWGIGGKTKALGYSWSSSSTPDWNTGNVVEINTFGKDGLDLRRFRLWSGDRFIGGIPALCDRSGRTIRAVQTSKRTSREEYYRLCNSGI